MSTLDTSEIIFARRAWIVRLPNHVDQRGQLTSCELSQFFVPARTFLVHGVPDGTVRGKHAHRTNRQLLICLVGCVTVELRFEGKVAVVQLDGPTKALLIEPGVWASQTYHDGAQLLVLASEPYDRNDHIVTES
jgi:dTDP-4-dehydrorhamnose 3,5-epimerase-like enzyme